jgi:hypothetical protein
MMADSFNRRDRSREIKLRVKLRIKYYASYEVFHNVHVIARVMRVCIDEVINIEFTEAINSMSRCYQSVKSMGAQVQN